MANITKPNFSNALWASGGAIVAPSDVKIATGWTAEVPPFQWENYSQNRQDQGIAHILQHGISVWDALTEYQAGISYVQGSDGIIYKAIQTVANQNPVTDVTFVYWQKATVGGLLSVRTFTTPGVTVYTPTPGTRAVRVIIVAGGGGGGGSTNAGAGVVSIGSAGGGGGAACSYLSTGFSGVNITVGGAGTAGAAGGAGGSGGTSSFGGLLTASGGVGGFAPGTPAATVVSVGNIGGSASGGNVFNSRGESGRTGVAISPTIVSGAGGTPMLWGGSGAEAATSYSAVLPGFAATQAGCGGSGGVTGNSLSAQVGGAGGAGKVIIEEYL